MPGTNASDAIVLLLEMQPAIVGSSRTNSPSILRRATATLVKAAGGLDIPVVVSAVPMGSDGAPELIPELAGHTPMVRSMVGAFDDPAIDALVAGTGRRLIALGGMSAEIALLHAVLGARHRNLEIHVLLDCCGGLSERTERAALHQMAQAGAVLSNVSSFLTLVAPDMATPGGQLVMAELAELWGWNDPDTFATASAAGR